MVMLGNPPYSGHSANKGAWISRLLRGQDGEKPTGSYFHVDGRPLGERNPKWLNDDYVKFMRFAQRRIERTGEGVLGFVTNHSYLDNPTFRGMRHSLMEAFDKIYLLDLHGNAKKKERTPDGGKDENVFSIQQGVAIGLFVRRGDSDNGPARIFHSDLWGEREAGDGGGKYGWLAAHDMGSTAWEELAPKPPLFLFVPRDDALSEEYEAYPKLTDVMPIHSVGVVTARDRLAIQWTEEGMSNVVADFGNRDTEDARSRYRLGKDARDWKVALAQKDVRESEGSVKRILYRPFDERFTYYTGKSRGFICMPRPEVMRHMLQGSNLGLITTKQCQTNPGVFIANSVIAHKSFSAYDINYLFPLNVWPKDADVEVESDRVPNFAPAFVKAVREAVGLDSLTAGAGNLTETFGQEDIFHYIYSVLHSPEYRRRYADFLKSDFPRIPLTGNRDLFASLVKLGQRLAALHLMEAEGPNPPAFAHTGSNRVDKLRYAPPSSAKEPGRVWINRDQCFKGVAATTWEFMIGGYRPAEKWLKDRKNRVLSYNDITHYRRICAALAETRQVMQRIDQAIDSRGGWPLQ